MKKISNIKIIFCILILSFIFIKDSSSQTRKGDYTSSFEYSTSFNIGRASDYISKPGWLGGQFTFKSFLKNNVAIGANFQLNVLAKEDVNGVTELPNGTISGPQARYLNYSPIYANVGYYFNKSLRGKFIPYIQANVGTIHVWQRLQVGANQIDNDTWHFGFGPEVGFVARVGYMVGITLNAKYNYALSSGETLVKSDDNSYSFFNLNLGLVYIR
ncbi:MAG: hypothetical protein IPL16_08095 [Ignavibacteria bacterium]|nr:hypothetical protein [Ignavibacteria bacterium]